MAAAGDPAVGAQVDEARQLFQQFMDVVKEVAADYRARVAATMKRANDLVLGHEIQLVTDIAAAMDTLDAIARRGIAQAKQAADEAKATGTSRSGRSGAPQGAGPRIRGAADGVPHRPVAAVRDRLTLLAGGQLATSMPVSGWDEVSETGTALGDALTWLRDLVTRLITV